MINIASLVSIRTGVFTIESTQSYSAKIMDANGKVVCFKQLSSGKENVRLKNEAKGIYLLEIQTNRKLIKTKLVLY